MKKLIFLVVLTINGYASGFITEDTEDQVATLVCTIEATQDIKHKQKKVYLTKEMIEEQPFIGSKITVYINYTKGYLEKDGTKFELLAEGINAGFKKGKKLSADLYANDQTEAYMFTDYMYNESTAYNGGYGGGYYDFLLLVQDGENGHTTYQFDLKCSYTINYE